MLLQLQGYLIGNGATDSATDNINIFQLYSNWPLIPPSLSAELTANECGTLSNPIGKPSLAPLPDATLFAIYYVCVQFCCLQACTTASALQRCQS